MRRSGAQIVRRSLEEPLRQIVANAGEEGAVVVAQGARVQAAHFGYNAASRQLRRPGQGRRHRSHQGNPHGTAERRLRSAGLLLTTEALVVEIP